MCQIDQTLLKLDKYKKNFIKKIFAFDFFKSSYHKDEGNKSFGHVYIFCLLLTIEIVNYDLYASYGSFRPA